MWFEKYFTFIWIFNVGRGLSVLIRFPHNIGIIYDLGSSDEFSPARFIEENIVSILSGYKEDGKEERRIAQCILSHPHTDHIQELSSIISDKRGLNPYLLTCHNDKEQGELRVDFSRIENEENKELIRLYKQSYEARNPPLRTILPPEGKYSANNIEYGIYYLAPGRVNEIHPSDDHLYCNGLSIVLYLRHGKQSLLIPGDITPEAFKEVIDGNQHVQKRYTYLDRNINLNGTLHMKNGGQPILKELLKQRGLTVLVAPHHGLESNFCEYLYEVIDGHKTRLNVISEKRHLSDKDGDVSEKYQSADYSLGIEVDNEGKTERRYSVTTREGKHILIVFKGTNALPEVHLRTNPKDLLKIY